MPEIPGYQPPSTQESHPVSANSSPSLRLPQRSNARYFGAENYGPHPPVQLIPTQVDHNTLDMSLGSLYRVSSQPHITNCYRVMSDWQSASIANGPSQQFFHQEFPNFEERPAINFSQTAATARNTTANPNTRTDIPDSSDVRPIEWEWLKPEVPTNVFGLFGETLLCPLKITIYILQELLRKTLGPCST